MDTIEKRAVKIAAKLWQRRGYADMIIRLINVKNGHTPLPPTATSAIERWLISKAKTKT